MRFKKLVHSGLPILPYPYLREGRRVRIIGGPLADVEVSSITVHLDCTLLEAA